MQDKRQRQLTRAMGVSSSMQHLYVQNVRHALREAQFSVTACFASLAEGHHLHPNELITRII